MKVSQYQRQLFEPSSAGGVLREGAGVAQLGAARGLSAMQKATAALAERNQEAERVTVVAGATLGLRKAYGDWMYGDGTPANPGRINQIGNHSTLAADSDAYMALLGEQVLSGVTDPLSIAALSKEVLEFSGTQGLFARKEQTKQTIDWSRGQLDKHLYEARVELAGVTLPGERIRLSKQSGAIINNAVLTGYISPVEGEKKLRAFVDGSIEDQLNIAIHTQPDNVLELLYGLKPGEKEASAEQKKVAEKYALPDVSGLTAGARTALILKAERRSKSLQDKEIADERREIAADAASNKALQQNRYGVMYGNALTGNLTAPDIMTALELEKITGPHARTLLDTVRAIDQVGGPGNPQVTDELRTRAHLGLLTAGNIYDAKADFGLNAKESRELLDLLHAGAESIQTSAYKAAAKWLSDQFIPAGALSGFGVKAEHTQHAAGALRDLYTEVSGDPTIDPVLKALEINNKWNHNAGRGFDSKRLEYEYSVDDLEKLRKGAMTEEQFNEKGWLQRSEP